MTHFHPVGRASATSAANHMNCADLTAPKATAGIDFAAQRPSNCTHLCESSLENMDALIAHAKKQVETGEALLGTYFVRYAETTVSFCPDANTSQERDETVRFIKNFVAKVNPDFVLLIANGWTLPNPTSAKYAAALNKYGSVRASPKAIRSVIFSLETSTGLYAALPRVVPKSLWSTRKMLEKASWHEVNDGNGTFQRVFPAQGSH
jgi:hypothetical protein